MEAGSEFRIGAAGEPVTGGEPVSRQPGDRLAVDPLGQVVVLDLDLRLVEIDVPGAPRGAPAVAAGLQEVFELLRCPFGPEPNGGFLAVSSKADSVSVPETCMAMIVKGWGPLWQQGGLRS